MTPEVEYLVQPLLVYIHDGLYLNPEHVAACYTDQGITVILLSSGQEVRQPGLDLVQLVNLLTN